MELDIWVERTIKISAIEVVLPVNYEEEDIPNNFPLRNGETWAAVIDIDTGKIRDWPAGAGEQKMYMKVVDGGSYYLIGEDGKRLLSIEDNYVPCCIPGDSGDYIDFRISADGTIENWRDYCTEKNVANSFCED